MLLLSHKKYLSLKFINNERTNINDRWGGGVINPINPSESTYCDICFYDKINDKLVIAKKDGWSYSENFIPIGIVVVPGSHNVYGNGSCGVMSLKYMNYSTPNEGSTTAQYMCWGGYGYDTSLKNLNAVPYVGNNGSVGSEIQGVNNIAELPSDIFSAVNNPYDPQTNYLRINNDYAPSPYGSDGVSRNPKYYQTASPSSTANCLADFDGVGNTNVLTSLATRQANWKTDSTIANESGSGYYPAACCCWRYSTLGTAQGDWYLPAIGELGYFMVRLKTINETISDLITAYGSTNISLIDIYGFWASTQYDSNDGRILNLNFGAIYYGEKNLEGQIRAFIRV